MALAARLARRRLIEQPLISARSATPDINSMRMAVAIPSSALRWVLAIPARHVGNRQIAGQTTNVLNATWDFAWGPKPSCAFRTDVMRAQEVPASHALPQKKLLMMGNV